MTFHPDIDVVFFGVWSPDRLGHFLYRQDGMTLGSFGPFIPESLDGRLLRCGHRIYGQSDLTCFQGYTVMAFVDQTADRRPGSNGCFICDRSAMLLREIWAQAEVRYPTITRRLQGHVRLPDPPAEGSR